MYLVYKRPSLWPFLLVGVMSFVAGILLGDGTADRRFEERAASIIDYVSHAREDAERLRESLKRGCYDFVDPRSGSSKFVRGM